MKKEVSPSGSDSMPSNDNKSLSAQGGSQDWLQAYQKTLEGSNKALAEYTRLLEEARGTLTEYRKLLEKKTNRDQVVPVAVMEPTPQKELVIAILGGATTLASLALAFFGFVYSTFTQIMSKVGAEKPPVVVYDLKRIAFLSFLLTAFPSVIVGGCIWWLIVPRQPVFFSIWFGFLLTLFALCGILWYIIIRMMKVR